MFEIVVRLEQSITGKELNQDTPYTPDITREAPSQIQNDLRCAVVSCGDDGRMVFVIECCRTEIDQADLTVEKDFPLACNSGGGGMGRTRD